MSSEANLVEARRQVDCYVLHAPDVVGAVTVAAQQLQGIVVCPGIAHTRCESLSRFGAVAEAGGVEPRTGRSMVLGAQVRQASVRRVQRWGGVAAVVRGAIGLCQSQRHGAQVCGTHASGAEDMVSAFGGVEADDPVLHALYVASVDVWFHGTTSTCCS